MSIAEDVSIRLASVADLDDVACVWYESASTMGGLSSAMPSARELRERIDIKLRHGWEIYVAVRSGNIVGLLAIKRSDQVLDQIFIRPDEQGQGVGMRLLDEAKRRMPTGFTVRMAASNNRARRFYENQGLILIRHGQHPRHGFAVEFYAYSPADGS